jgi:hypothetical protein
MNPTWSWLRPKSLYAVSMDCLPLEYSQRQIRRHFAGYYVRLLEAVARACERSMDWECEDQQYRRN